jgi:hypothetical protein
VVAPLGEGILMGTLNRPNILAYLQRVRGGECLALRTRDSTRLGQQQAAQAGNAAGAIAGDVQGRNGRQRPGIANGHRLLAIT